MFHLVKDTKVSVTSISTIHDLLSLVYNWLDAGDVMYDMMHECKY